MLSPILYKPATRTYITTPPPPPSYPEMELVHAIHAHPGNCICIKFEPHGRYFATGSVDALVSVWDAQELYCIRTLGRLVQALALLPPPPPHIFLY